MGNPIMGTMGPSNRRDPGFSNPNTWRNLVTHETIPNGKSRYLAPRVLGTRGIIFLTPRPLFLHADPLVLKHQGPFSSDASQNFHQSRKSPHFGKIPGAKYSDKPLSYGAWITNRKDRPAPKVSCRSTESKGTERFACGWQSSRSPKCRCKSCGKISALLFINLAKLPIFGHSNSSCTYTLDILKSK